MNHIGNHRDIGYFIRILCYASMFNLCGSKRKKHKHHISGLDKNPPSTGIVIPGTNPAA